MQVNKRTAVVIFCIVFLVNHCSDSVVFSQFALSKDGRWSANAENGFVIISNAENTSVFKVRHAGQLIDGLSFSHSGRRLAVSGKGGTLILSEPTSDSKKWSVAKRIPSLSMRNLVFTKDNQLACKSDGELNRIDFWDIDNAKKTGSLQVGGEAINLNVVDSLVFDNETEVLVAATNFGVVGIDSNTTKEIWRTKRNRKQFSRILIGAWNGSVQFLDDEKLWCLDAATGKVVDFDDIPEKSEWAAFIEGATLVQKTQSDSIDVFGPSNTCEEFISGKKVCTNLPIVLIQKDDDYHILNLHDEVSAAIEGKRTERRRKTSKQKGTQLIID